MKDIESKKKKKKEMCFSVMWRSRTRMSREITSIIGTSCETKSTQLIQRCLNICRELKGIRAELNVPLVWIQFSSSLTSLHLLDRTSELKKLLHYWLWWTRSWPAIQKKKNQILALKSCLNLRTIFTDVWFLFLCFYML